MKIESKWTFCYSFPPSKCNIGVWTIKHSTFINPVVGTENVFFTSFLHKAENLIFSQEMHFYYKRNSVILLTPLLEVIMIIFTFQMHSSLNSYSQYHRGKIVLLQNTVSIFLLNILSLASIYLIHKYILQNGLPVDSSESECMHRLVL